MPKVKKIFQSDSSSSRSAVSVELFSGIYGEDAPDQLADEETNRDEAVSVEEDSVDFEVIEEEVGDDDDGDGAFVDTKKQKKMTKAEKQKEEGRVHAKKLENGRKENARKFSSKIKKIGRNFHCKLCDKVTVFKQIAEMHSRRCGEEIKTATQKKRSLSVKCSICPEKFASSSEMNKHNVEEHEQRQICSQCDKTFKTYKTWRRHLKEIHSGDQGKFQCKKCTYKTSRKTLLKRHMVTKHKAWEPAPSVRVSSAVEQSNCGIRTPSIRNLKEGLVLVQLSDKKVHIVSQPDQEDRQVLKRSCTIGFPFSVSKVVVSWSGDVFALLSSNSILLFRYEGMKPDAVEVPSSLTAGPNSGLTWLPTSSSEFVVFKDYTFKILRLLSETVELVQEFKADDIIVDVAVRKEENDNIKMYLMTEQGLVVELLLDELVIKEYHSTKVIFL